MLFSTRVPPRARVTFLSGKVTKAILPLRRTHPHAQSACGWVPCAPQSARGFFDSTSLYCEKRAHPVRAPQGNSLRALSSPTCGARCDSRGREHLNQANQSKPKTQHLKILTLGCFHPPFRRAEHRRPRRSRPDRGAHVMRALAAGQESCVGQPPSRPRSARGFRARGAGTAIIKSSNSSSAAMNTYSISVA